VALILENRDQDIKEIIEIGVTAVIQGEIGKITHENIEPALIVHNAEIMKHVKTLKLIIKTVIKIN
jgi:hypothetical protein